MWYGVGSDNADLLEAAMKSKLPELFDKHPDLLHQLVTAVSPADLIHAQVPVYKAVQCPGEFVVTFPRGYHGGFNSGFNVAEAVNFAQPDWIKYGVRALRNYSETNRPAAFSHQELMLSCARAFPVTSVAANLLQELYRLTDEYDKARHLVHKHGVQKYARGNELSPIPQCSHCMVDCYFACIRCGCAGENVACLKCIDHIDWCNKECKGLFFFERVPIDVLDSLILKMEARLSLPALCRMAGCSGCCSTNEGSASSKRPPAPSPKFVPNRKRSPAQVLGRRAGLFRGSQVDHEALLQTEAPKTRAGRAKWYDFRQEEKDWERNVKNRPLRKQ